MKLTLTSLWWNKYLNEFFNTQQFDKYKEQSPSASPKWSPIQVQSNSISKSKSESNPSYIQFQFQVQVRVQFRFQVQVQYKFNLIPIPSPNPSPSPLPISSPVNPNLSLILYFAEMITSEYENPTLNWTHPLAAFIRCRLQIPPISEICLTPLRSTYLLSPLNDTAVKNNFVLSSISELYDHFAHWYCLVLIATYQVNCPSLSLSLSLRKQTKLYGVSPAC